MESFLFQATIYLAAAVIAVPISARLGFGSVLGYLAAGILIGPVLGLVGAEAENLRRFGEFGVVMMLFMIGLDLDPRALWDMRHRLIGMGGLQIALSAAVLTAVALAAGRDWRMALAIGLTLALSSTAIVLQTLAEKGLMQSRGGRSAFAVLLTQDIAVIPILAALPLLAAPPSMQLAPDGSIRPGGGAAGHGLSLVEGLPGWGVTLVTAAAVAFVVLGGIYLARPVFRYIHASGLREMYTALALLIVVGIAFLMEAVGLSPALGAFMAGAVLANSEFRHELESDLAPFKGLLLGLFFITVGADIDLGALQADFGDLLGLAMLLVLAKGLVLHLLAVIFRLHGRDRWLFTLGLAQAGEFGFVLLGFAAQVGVVPAPLADKLLLVVALTMLLTPLLFLLYEALARRIPERAESLEPDEIDERGPIIIAGIGRFGQVVNRLVRGSGFRTVVLDHDMETIRLMRRFGIKGFLGDPTRPELLRAAGLGEACVLVAALDDPAQVTKLVRHARRERPDLHIIARARDRAHVFELYRAGADDIVRELFDSSLRAGRYVLENVGLSEYEAAQAEQTFYAHDRYALKELAEVWDPDIPPSENPEYVRRARELEAELQSALLALAEKAPRKSA